MARGFSDVTLLGALTATPELKYTTSGLALCEVNLAGRTVQVGDDGQTREPAWYHRATLFGKPAEWLAEAQHPPGVPVLVRGRLNYRNWDDPSGQKRSALDVTAFDVSAAELGARKDAFDEDARGQLLLKSAVNEVRLQGNLTRDPEVKTTPSGQSVARLDVAVNESYSKGGKDTEKVHYVSVTVWRELAELAGELSKGDPVYAAGFFSTESWTNQENVKQYRNGVVAQRLEVLSRRPGGATPAPKPQAAAPVRPKLDIDEEFPPEEDLPF